MQNVTVNNTALNAVIAKYSAIEGDYEANVWEGVEHYMFDSCICTDAFSVQDAERVAKLDEDFVYESGLLDINDAVKALDNGDDLDCVKCMEEAEATGYVF